ncbi:hypothetical protein HUT11_35220 (plasmid) [Streptomyces seoulensis]|nr:hypothetical protein HUT11_35220 [Streptomyces seoulensis]
MTCTQLANTAASGLVALCCLVFAIVYHLNAPWRSTPVGRHVMGFTLTIGALTAYTVAITFWPHGLVASVLQVIRTCLLLVTAALVLQRIHLVIRAQHRRIPLDVERDPERPSV